MSDRWVEVERIFTPPISEGKARQISESMMMRLAFGFTTIMYRDSKGRKPPQYIVVHGDQRRDPA